MNPSYYANIPAHVRYAKIKPHAKLLYGEITALSNKEGYCFASNKYFAELYNVTKNTVSLWIKELETHKFITNTIIKKDNQIVQRRLAIIVFEGSPIPINNDYNNINNNTTINNLSLKRRKNEFSDSVAEAAFECGMNIEEASKFFDYWSETNKSKTKMKFETQPTWELKLRLKRWNKMSKNIFNNSKSKIKKTLDIKAKAKELMNKINQQ